MSTQPSPKDGKWLALVAICGASFMLLVDVTIVQVALPSIQRAFHSSFTDLQWVISAYALSLSALILTSGSLSDRFGRKRIFVTGLVAFTVSSLLCGLSTGSLFLNLARALQGVGGAAMFATSLALIGQEYQGADRAKAIGIWGATVGAAVAVGPLAGGAITSGIGWRWIFFVNVPIGIVTVAMAVRLLRNVGDPAAKTVDLPGLVTFSGALFLLNLGLLQGGTDGWSSGQIVGYFAGAVVLFVAFIVAELRQKRPMFDLSLFRNPGFCGVSIGTFAIGMGMFAQFTYLTLYLQNDLGFSPFGGGLRVLPCTLPCFAVPLFTHKATEKWPAGAVLGGGLLLTAIGIATMDHLNVTSSWTALLPGLILTGIGIGFANPSIAKIGLGVVHPARTGMASGISNTMRIAGLATGIATFGAALEARIRTELKNLLPGAPPQLAGAISSGGTRAAVAAVSARPQMASRVAAVSQRAFPAGMNEIFLIGTIIVLVGAVAAFALVRARHFFAMPVGAGNGSAGSAGPSGARSEERGAIVTVPSDWIA